MRLRNTFQPRTILSRDEVTRGLRALTWEGIASTGFSSLTTSTFLVAFALALGANNFQIGVMASLPFVTDLFQIPAVWVIEKLRLRKVIVIITWLISQLLWIPIAFIPIVVEIPSAWAISMLLGLMAVRGILNALTNCGWSSWKRDLVPQNMLGRYFARRLSLATAVGVILGLSAGYLLDYWNSGEGGVIGYSCVLLIGLVFFGLVSPVLMASIPEPMMPPAAAPRTSFIHAITMPLREQNYWKFLKFLMLWGFASNMAIPFFAVFMLQQLNLPIFTVIAVTMLSEVFTVLSLRLWGPLADRFGSKTVLNFSTSLFLLVLMAWAFTVITGGHPLIVPLLIVLHIFTGIAVAGITLTVGTLSFKMAPQDQATSYLTGASLADSAGSGLGALAGGSLAELLAERTLTLDSSWSSLFRSVKLDSIQLTGYHLLFAVAFIICLLALWTLQAVREVGATRREALLTAFMTSLCTGFQWLNPTLDRVFLAISPFSCIEPVKETRREIPTTINYFGNAGRKPTQIVPAAIRVPEKKPPPCMKMVVP